MNAIDAMPDGGKLIIRTLKSENDGYVKLEIEDTGIGIPPENLPKIFDPFFTTKEVGKGTGLGLSVVYGIVEDHRGKINVKSAPGQGTTVTIDFPACEKGEILF
jgi:signal transduction histidine kinase